MPAPVNLPLSDFYRLTTREDKVLRSSNVQAITCVLAIALMGVSIYAPAQGQSLPGAAIRGSSTDPRPEPSATEKVDPMIDGNRLGFAQEWSNNFCLRWTDGCSTCSRGEVWGAIACHVHDDSTCRRRPVVCQAADYGALNLSCARYGADCNEYEAWVDNPDGGTGMGTRMGCLPIGEARLDYRCLKDWAFEERWYCSSDTPDSERYLCEADKIAKAAAGRAARPNMSFPGLKR